ncbi:MAG: M15 family metallopeptidase [Caldimonas sp.]
MHPDLVRVIRAASQKQPFVVTYGLRTAEAEAEAVRTGHSQTMHSRHLANKEGLACAVDVTPLIDGKLSFAPGHEQQVYGAIAVAIKSAAFALNTPVEWGGDWRSFKDWGHFQLPWASYP